MHDHSGRRAASSATERQESYARFIAITERVRAERGSAGRGGTRVAEAPATQPPSLRSAASRAEARRRPYFTDGDGAAGYAWVADEGHVDDDVRRAAHRGREFAAAHLRIAEPALKFFRRATGDEREAFRAPVDRSGFAWTGSNEIAVTTSIDWTVAAEIGAHETFHVARPSASEADTVAYAGWAAELLISPRGDLAQIHRFDGWPDKFATCADRCEPFDVLFAEGADGQPQVYRNLGAWRAPSWSAHFRSCPV